MIKINPDQARQIAADLAATAIDDGRIFCRRHLDPVVDPALLCIGHIPAQPIDEAALLDRFSHLVFPLKYRAAVNSGPKSY